MRGLILEPEVSEATLYELGSLVTTPLHETHYRLVKRARTTGVQSTVIFRVRPDQRSLFVALPDKDRQTLASMCAAEIRRAL